MRLRREVFQTLPALVLMAACGATSPGGISEANIQAYMAAVASIGCELRYDSDYAPVEFQTGLSQAQVLEITTYMLSRGRAVRLPEGGVRLTTGACA